MFFMSYIHLYCLLLHARHCCRNLVAKVTNKVQENLQSKECYQKDKINSEKLKMGTKLVGDMSYFGDCPRKPGMNDHLSQDEYMEAFYCLLQLLQMNAMSLF
jgi:hypothetical protein